MSERLTYQDLDRDELLALLDSRPLLCRQSDLVWAKWEVTSQRSIDVFKLYMGASEITERAFDAYRKKGDSKSLAAYETAKSKEKRLRDRSRRLSREADQLYQRHQKLREASQ